MRAAHVSYSEALVLALWRTAAVLSVGMGLVIVLY